MTGPAVKLGSWAPGTPEWHAARATRLGGSEIAAVLGLSKWESPFSLWHRKAGLADLGYDNDEMAWGRRLEPVIVDAFAERHPELTVHRDAGTWVHADRDWQLANPDALLSTDGAEPHSLLEAKTARYDDEWGPDGTDEIPPYYRAQVLWYLDVFGFDSAVLAVLIAGSDYREYGVWPMPGELEALRREGERFMGTVTAGERPSIDDHERTYETVRWLPDGVTDTTATIDEATAGKWLAMCQIVKQAEADKRYLSSLILDAIGDGRHAETPDGVRVATRAVTRAGKTHSLRPNKRLIKETS